MGSATASQAGEGSTVNCPEPSAQTSAMVMGPSYQTPGCAAVTLTGWDPIALWVSVSVSCKSLESEFGTRTGNGIKSHHIFCSELKHY